MTAGVLLLLLWTIRAARFRFVRLSRPAHTFLLITTMAQPMIIDLSLHELYDVVRPTEKHRRVMRVTQPWFVGRLEDLVRHLHEPCTSATWSLKEQRMHIPPWREWSNICLAYHEAIMCCLLMDSTKDICCSAYFE